ncbi:MAG: glycoside hydrolase family 65 protein [Spirochaetales bacterium]|nr:glycoside hydrolase family 65 protein [Spirochaetales bacterium]
MQDDARLVRRTFDPTGIAKEETLFALSNGRIGLRGNQDEGGPAWHRGTYVNGFFDGEPIVYGEKAYGYAERHQTMLNVPDGKRFTLELDGKPFRVDDPSVFSYSRTLDMDGARLDRVVDARLPSGAVLRLSSSRLACLDRPSTAAFSYGVRVLSGEVRVTVRTGLDPEVGNLTSRDDPRVGARFTERPLVVASSGGSGRTVHLGCLTRSSALALGCAASQRAILSRRSAAATEREPDSTPGPVPFEQSWTLALAAGDELTVEKAAAWVPGPASSLESLVEAARADAEAALSRGFGTLAAEQAMRASAFWASSDIRVGGDEASQEALRFNLFHLWQAAGRDGRTGLCAKGLSGEGYEGHAFWDTEIYACTVFDYTAPELSKALLSWRHATLDRARARAGTLSHRGALFPWRTIDGEEASAYYPAGTAQYHIDADIAYACERYVSATGDLAFLRGEAAELAVETARFWLSIGDYGRDGRFHIHCVTGPDEYTALVDDNRYTNRMARRNLRFAAGIAELLESEAASGSGAALELLRVRTGLRDGEPEAWRKAAEAMELSIDPETGITPQDATFLSKPAWDFAGTPRDKYPLLLHFHPLEIYRHRVLKQPDVVLAQFLLPAEFDAEQKRRDFNYYEPLTTGDSSLSHCVQSVMAAELGEIGKAWDYFIRTSRMDLDDVHGNSRDGVHIAAMAGTWISAVCGFGGFRELDGEWSFAPRLPEAWTSLEFRLSLRGLALAVRVGRGTTEYALAAAAEPGKSGSLRLRHHGTSFEIRQGEARRF